MHPHGRGGRHRVDRRVDAHRRVELDVDRLGVATQDRHAHARRGDRDVGQVHDLAGLHDHLPLFLGEPVVHEDVDMRDHVEGDLLGELLRLDRVGDEEQVQVFGADGFLDDRYGLETDEDSFLPEEDLVRPQFWKVFLEHVDRQATEIGIFLQ